MMRWFGSLFGRRLRRWRAGPEFRVAEDVRFAFAPRTMELRSSTFADGAPLPPGKDSPPLEWSNVPAETAMLVLVVEDVDVPFPRPLVHALAYGIDATTDALDAGALDGAHATMGYNGGGHQSYIAPAPIPGHGPHRYYFTLLAVDFVPRFDQPPTKGRLLDAIAGHVIALAEIHGTAER
ncbi:MAG TPA: YbhB/YbcL family Raf kinase inhibitor-like protein [Candidatus Elarobacter sp.]|nr:YbhB/YbcL family Raf kinase inhibitor-like protein [Candidatus Elarobacter sp.]